MKKLFLSIAALVAAFSFGYAQNLTMEEAVLGRGVATPDVEWHWTSDKNIAASDGIIPARPPQRPQEDEFVFTKGNNLYYMDAEGVEHAITSYDDPSIVCGQSVSRSEFGIDGGIFVSPDRSRIAFYKKDESAVTDYPLYNVSSRTGETRYIKYPMNGMASENVFLGVYDIASGATSWMNVTDFDSDRYLTNITWNPSGDKIYIQVLDRAQKHMHLNRYDALSGAFEACLLTEENPQFVEPSWPLHFVEGRPSEFIYETDNRDGWKNLYLCSADGAFEPRRLTVIDADVEYITQDSRYVYYYCCSPVTDRRVYRSALKGGKPECLTPDSGWHTASFSDDMKYFVDKYTSFSEPCVCRLATSAGKTVRELGRVTEDMVPAQTRNCILETGTFKSADGLYDNAYSLVKPADFDPSKKYPVVLYVYGGPHSQLITNRYRGGMSLWDILMAQKGYIVLTMDNRGTSNHGAAYEKAIHRRCGKAEMEDQMVGVRWLMSQPWVDSSRIGVHGWSYGGFMTISLMTHYPDVFSVGVAGGPVIDWKWYEVMYGERYMETEATNPEGFASTSLIPRARDLRGKLLICQGVIDNTVVWQHSLSFVESCIKNGVQVDYFPYPTHEHNVRGKDRVHLMNKVTDYFEDYLK